ncbi:N-acetylglucosamine-binding protein GbpA [Photobacterium sp. OFAV2-7]|uniref:N-acetylglucosamine-binding protein GbpA n=1 Tax=Photobacterium sp. OFAV2-7 TaxID=2917748 RepID=UPI001EF4C27F|nr:N-acetylglucosamine-binding protein GbpA [Photobacterium sp. OFAV2-7]MCG7588678.1 N-acetylglucosamine-binding protein GbpA [Photobacterium sp. OFAV2-7]
MKRPFPLKTTVALLFLGGSSAAIGHGYVSALENGVAEGRATLCKYPTADTGEKNIDCGAIQYEPQSVEGPDGFPEAGPVDGKIASAENALALALDEQTSDRWVKRPIQPGNQYFEWAFTANHVTKDWKYYLTKQGWNPNQVLTRDAFDLTPFCVVDGNMEQPPTSVSHLCNVPEREGYQVILAVWDVGDTDASFYNVIDVEFDGENGGSGELGWSQGGQIIPTMDLSVGDAVYTRVFDRAGENPSYSTKLTIGSQDQGIAKNWSFELANKVNKEQSGIRAGHLNEGKITPIYGTNPVFLKAGSGIHRVEIGYDTNGQEMEPALAVSGLESEYIIDEEPVNLDLSLDATGDLTAVLTVYNHAREALASLETPMTDGETKSVTLELSKSQPGHHMLVTRIKNSDGEFVNQTMQDFQLVEGQTPPPSGEYDYVFPDGLEQYTEGTKVLATDGQIYQCKEFPYSGYCVQWSSSATQYEPGVGTDWESAWYKLD